MKFTIFSILVLATAVLAETKPQKSVIVSYAPNTPDSIVEQAESTIMAAGGIITQHYRFMKGFAAQCNAEVLETVETAGKEWGAVIEENQMVSINNSRL